MKIQNSKIEFKFVQETRYRGKHKQCYRYYTATFIKTPKGRRKELMYVEERLNFLGQILEITIDIGNGRTRKERQNLLNAFFAYIKRTELRVNYTTIEIMQISFISDIKMVSFTF